MFRTFKSISVLLSGLLFVLTSCTSTPPTTPTSEKPGTGLVLTDDKTLASLPFADNLPKATKVPDAVDLSVSFPTPGDQGNQGSCVGWAAAYLKTFQEVAETGKAPNTLFFSPSFVYNQIKVGDCDSGSKIDDALNLLSEQGDVAETVFPYDDTKCDELPNDALKLQAGPFKIASWRRANTQDPTELKRHLANETPVLIAFETDDAFFDLKKEVYKDPPSKNAGNHAMVVVGYDDKKNAFKVINSWGTAWGDGGFGWIDYDTFTEKTLFGFVAQDLKTDNDKGKPTIESFTASPTAVSAGGSSTLNWTVTGEKPLTLTLTSTTGIDTDVTDASEYELLNIDEDVTLTLEAENSEGKTSQSITITVGSPFKLLSVTTDPDGTSEIPFSADINNEEHRVAVTIDYEAVIPSKYAGLRIWAIPYSENVFTPSSFYAPSDIITAQTGTELRYFGVKDTGAFSQIVDGIYIWVEAVVKDGNEGTSQETRELFYSEQINQEFIFKNP